MSSGHDPTLAHGIPKVGDRRGSWVGIWELTPYLDKNQQVQFIFDKNNAKVETHMGDGPAVITDGYGGWSQVTRPRTKALTQWDGGNGFTMSVPVVISGWFNDSSIESRVRRLEQMARSGEGESEPPPLAVTLPGDSPRDGESFIWVLPNIEWGNSRRRDDDGHRTYQEATLTFWEYVRPDIVQLAPAKKRRVTKRKAKKKVTSHRKLKKPVKKK